MKLENLSPAKGSVKKSTRIGRGIGSGKGRTSGRGHKGAKSRSGYSKKIGFEGGQMPLQRRVPKFGFNNINRVEYRAINLDSIQALIEIGKISSKVDKASLVELGLAHKNDLVKILGRGQIKSAISFEVNKCSETAKSAIEAAGGSIELV